jgi:peptidoglycan/LPS O-acetylase OafA/YrhL
MAQAKNNDIQCLRAIAIVLVVMQHMRARLPTPEWYATLFTHVAFWPGVDIFFAISGFLICKTLLRDLENGPSKREALAGFWLRRVVRLLPTATFWCIASVAISFFTKSVVGAEPAKVALSAATGILGISNGYWAMCVQAASNACGSADFNGVTWSLSLEWQLYSLLTILVCAAGRRWAAAMLLSAAVVMAFFPGPSFSFIWAFRLQAFTLGVIAFLLYERSPRIAATVPPALSLTMLIAGITLCLTAPVVLPQPFVLPLIAVGAGLCLAAAVPGQMFSNFGIAAPMRWVGERSYSIYLCHLPMILVTREIASRANGLQPSSTNVMQAFILFICLLVVASEISYRMIEIRFQHLARQSFPRWFTGTSVGIGDLPTTLKK